MGHRSLEHSAAERVNIGTVEKAERTISGIAGKMCAAFIIVFACLSFGWREPVLAHFASTGYSEIRVAAQELDYRLFLSEEEMIEAVGLDEDADGRLSRQELKAGEQALQSFINEYLLVTGNGRLGQGVLERYATTQKANQQVLQMDVRYVFPEPVEQYLVQYYLFSDKQNSGHRNIATITFGDHQIHQVLGPNNEIITLQGVNGSGTGGAVTWEIPAFLATWIDFTGLGIHHILTGFDHLLFLLGVILIVRSFRQTVWIVTSFTVGHSITLAFAALGIADLPGAFVEPMIALSIVYIAVENVLGKGKSRRWLTTLIFGLVHGFGFAGMLADSLPEERVLLPLFSFNLGVELGQLLVLCIVLPLFRYGRGWMVRSAKGVEIWNRGMSAVSVLIGLIGMYWFVERVFL
jgi:hydrogenase/urease accessory protein HupE